MAYYFIMEQLESLFCAENLFRLHEKKLVEKEVKLESKTMLRKFLQFKLIKN